jgi:hypothetical protein
MDHASKYALMSMLNDYMNIDEAAEIVEKISFEFECKWKKLDDLFNALEPDRDNIDDVIDNIIEG